MARNNYPRWSLACDGFLLC